MYGLNVLLRCNDKCQNIIVAVLDQINSLVQYPVSKHSQPDFLTGPPSECPLNVNAGWAANPWGQALSGILRVIASE